MATMMTWVGPTLDVLAVVLLSAVLWRLGRDPSASWGAREARLQAIFDDLRSLVAQSEGLARDLDGKLAGREERLRALLSRGADGPRRTSAPAGTATAALSTRDEDRAQSRRSTGGERWGRCTRSSLRRLAARIEAFAEAGTGVDEIARRLGVAAAEVRLVIGLKAARAARRRAAAGGDRGRMSEVADDAAGTFRQILPRGKACLRGTGRYRVARALLDFCDARRMNGRRNTSRQCRAAWRRKPVSTRSPTIWPMPTRQASRPSACCSAPSAPARSRLRATAVPTPVTHENVVTDFSQGAISKSGNPLDVALAGDGFLVVKTDRGERLTRSGNFSIDSAGYLATADGSRVQGTSGDISIPKSPVVIAADGSVRAGDQRVGQLRLVTVDDPTQLVRESGTRFARRQPSAGRRGAGERAGRPGGHRGRQPGAGRGPGRDDRDGAGIRNLHAGRRAARSSDGEGHQRRRSRLRRKAS